MFDVVILKRHAKPLTQRASKTDAIKIIGNQQSRKLAVESVGRI